MKLLAALLLASVAALAAPPPAYVTPVDVDLARYVPPPPAADTPAQRDDLAAVLAAQQQRSAAGVQEALADQKVSVFRFADVLGERFAQDRLPKTAALGEKACKEASNVVAVAKKRWNRPRPYVASREVKPVVSNVTEGSYPSGHATCGYLWAIVLADLIPEKRAELFARGIRYGTNRVLGGVHYPTDAEAGRLSAVAISAAMYSNAGFREDLAAARSEVRAVMGYQP